MMTSGLTFFGKYVPYRKYANGDVVDDCGDIKIYVDGSWVELCKEESLHHKDTIEIPKTIAPRTCSQCGAPIKIYKSTCEYCGVRY